MFFFLSKTFANSAFPIPLLILALLIVFIFYRRRWARVMLIITLCTISVLSLPLTANLLLSWLEIPPVKIDDLAPQYDAVVVLTGMTNLRITADGSRKNGVEFEGAVDRIIAGIQIIHSGKAQSLILSGGSGDLFNQGALEAPRLKEFAVSMGIAEQQIIVEKRSRNTFENAKYTAQIARENGFDTLLLITSSFHMRRALACFQKQELNPDVFPVDFRSYRRFYPNDLIPSSEALADVRIVERELIGLLAYKLRGYI